MANSRKGKGNAPRGMILLARGNRILEETVRDQICRDPDESRPKMLDVKLCDFDDVSYNIKIDGADRDTPAPMVVSISCPAYLDIKDKGADTAIAAAFADHCTIMDEPAAGMDVSLEFNWDTLTTDAKEQEALVQRLSMFKFHLLSGPFRTYFDAMTEGKAETEPSKFDLRSDTTVYMKPAADRVTVIFAIDFQNKVDKVLARVFMQELCDARKRVRTAPPFKWSVPPPGELQSMGCTENPGILGYASITVMASHVSTADRTNDVISALINFRTFIQYHLKCAKSFFHSRMRKRCSDLLKILNRAKVKFGETSKKTKSGKTFKRN